MSEELLQRGLLGNPEKLGKWNFYNIGATTLKVLKEYKIIPVIDYKKFERRKPDGLITSDNKVIAVISNKLPKNLKTEKQIDKEITDWIEVTKILKSKLLIITDTKKTIWINALISEPIKDENGNELKQIFNPKDIEMAKLIEKILNSIDEKTSQLISPKLKDPSSLAKQIWQDIWSVSGATPENCLYTFVELFIFKYLSDLGILTGSYSFDELMKKYNIDTEEEVLEDYATRIRPKIKDLFPQNLIDKTTIINGTIFVSKDEKAVKGYSTVFRKVLEKFNNEGKLENIHHDFKSKIFESFLKESISKKNWGQFFTPLKVVQAIVQMTDIKEGMKICDPACGVGKFLLEPIIRDLPRFYKVDKDKKLVRNIELVGFDKGFDKDEQKTIVLAKANMLIYLSDLIKENPDITKQFSDLFNDTFLLKTNSILGTLSEPITDKYDLILTNPPYVTSGSSNIKEEIRKSGLEGHYTINAMGVEGLFAEWIIRALKPGGKAFIVIPDGILNRSNDKNLRRFILDECFIDAIISLPAKTFFTTIKKTYILAITKKTDKSVTQKEPVFTYLVNDIGETLDVYRFDTGVNHLEDAVILFRQFIGAKKHFKIDDKRCKIQPMEIFVPENHWAVDRWWAEQEKIDLGIIEEKNIMSVNDLSDFVGEIANTLLEYQSPLKELVEKKKNNRELKEVKLSDTNYFDLFIGERVVKRDLVKIHGNIPLYSANVFKPVGFLDKGNITDFNNDFVLWGIDGDFEFNYIKREEKFATTDHCGAVRIKTDKIIPAYLLHQLNEVKKLYGYDRSLRASLKNMKEVAINIPIDSTGEFDVEEQQEIANNSTLIEEIKEKVNFYKEKIESTNIILNIREYNFKEVSISGIFEVLPIPQKLSKKDIQKGGSIPVYSSQSDNFGLIGNAEVMMFDANEDSPLVTFGDHTRTIYIRTNPFSVLDNVKVLKLKEAFRNTVDIKYICYKWKPLIYDLGYSRHWKEAKNTKIPIPINSKDEYDLKAQKEISQKYQVIEQVKQELEEKLNNLLKVNVTL
ncbi:MAG: N-6 DNA methylase [Candidatus Desantisbacteria bacterium]